MSSRRRQPGWRVPVVLAAGLVLGLTGCAASAFTDSPGSAPTPTASPSPTTTTAATRPAPPSIPATTAATASAEPEPAPSPPPLAGKVIVIDPGHNGRYSKAFNTKQVPAGNGRKKACNSSGTAGAGLPEHAYTWKQAQELRAALEDLGAKVILTRQDDDGLGPCVNLRAGVANKAKADLLISIHADGSLARRARGFHVIRSTSMAGGPKLEQASREFAEHVRQKLEAETEMPRSTYIGGGSAFSPRTDIATLNLLQSTPGIMLEAGNMRNAADLKLLKSERFQEQVAKALSEAAVATLTD